MKVNKIKYHLDYEEIILRLGDEPENPLARKFYNFIKSKIEKRIKSSKSKYLKISTPHPKSDFMRKWNEDNN